MTLIESLNWRYAVKKMTGQRVPEEKLNVILEAVRLSASSSGLQPYHVVVVSDHILKGKIHELACRQPQVVEGSHLLVFASKTNVTTEYVDEQIELIANTRGVPVSGLAPFADSVKGSITSRTPEQLSDWAARQAYIALGFGLVAAAVEKIDATPMEGFNSEAMDEILGLKEKGLRSVVLMALGYRDEERDFLSKAKKVRKSRETFFIER